MRLLNETLSCFSRLLNVFAGSTADLSFSARSYRDDLWSRSLIDWSFWLLIGEVDHCRNSWKLEVERSYRNLIMIGKKPTHGQSR